MWSQACRETETAFAASNSYPATDDADDMTMDISTYFNQRQAVPIEHISVYRVPRAVFAHHVMDMADVALRGSIRDFPAFVQEASECWQMYGRLERMEREFCIKWAAQDYLYEILGWTKYMYRTPYVTATDEEYEAVSQLDAPAGYALVAYTAVFNGGTWDVNTARIREFWQWWLTTAIPEAWRQACL
ncbi:MAG: hypothetical protein M3R24_08995 [Chloroflexota bacterium]|nr:hypothetical protein [Chloroflexota bacterium]